MDKAYHEMLESIFNNRPEDCLELMEMACDNCGKHRIHCKRCMDFAIKEALKKQIPIEPKTERGVVDINGEEVDTEFPIHVCPNCGKILCELFIGTPDWLPKYCSECGVKIKWN